jgi:hypothetical protein
MAILENSFFSVMPDGCVLLALDYQKNKHILQLEDTLYVKFYSNEYYDNPVQNANNKVLYYKNYVNDGNLSTYISFQLSYENLITNVT